MSLFREKLMFFKHFRAIIISSVNSSHNVTIDDDRAEIFSTVDSITASLSKSIVTQGAILRKRRGHILESKALPTRTSFQHCARISDCFFKKKKLIMMDNYMIICFAVNWKINWYYVTYVLLHCIITIVHLRRKRSVRENSDDFKNNCSLTFINRARTKHRLHFITKLYKIVICQLLCTSCVINNTHYFTHMLRSIIWRYFA